MNSEELKLVRSIAGRYARLGAPFEDLVQEGMLGILEARKHYDENRGAKFTTYATYWVRKYVLRHVDGEMQYRSRNVELNEDILSAEESMHLPATTNETVAATERLDLPADMPAGEQRILRLLYEERLSLSQIAEKLQMRREKVRQLQQTALRRLRQCLPEQADKLT
ncbi:MAG: sigma-70 family RNA polymerase sigma factor [Candidatus Cloacimonetes bacterium]|nr:sigma-70 family RNA polymerase sigma factor [Candidatus Cloacimonadota bacterium]